MPENHIYIKKRTLVILLAIVAVAVILVGVFASSAGDKEPANGQELAQSIHIDDFDCDACVVSNCPLRR